MMSIRVKKSVGTHLEIILNSLHQHDRYIHYHREKEQKGIAGTN